MSDTPETKPAEPAAPAAAAAPAKRSGPPLLLVLILPALFSAGAAFGAVKAAGHGQGGAAHAEAPKPELHPPGPTVALDPFLVAVVDASKKSHPMKLSIAIEFEATAKEEALKAFTPRIRDAVLAHVRTLSYEEATDPHTEKLREDLLERCKKVGAHSAERVLITDMVSQ